MSEEKALLFTNFKEFEQNSAYDELKKIFNKQYDYHIIEFTRNLSRLELFGKWIENELPAGSVSNHIKLFTEYKIWLVKQRNWYYEKETDIKLPFKQTKSWGCSLYCLSNFFNDNWFISHTPPEKTGIDMVEESELISKFENNLGLRILPAMILPDKKYFHDFNNLVIRYNYSNDDTDQYVPLLLGVTTDNNINHRILVLKKNDDNMLYVCDSMFENVIEMNEETLVAKYNIYNLSHITLRNIGDNNFTSADRNSLKHLIP